MKIVNRKTFMQMPKGTVFCKFPRYNEATRSYSHYIFSITEPYIKMDEPKADAHDFYAMGLGSDLDPKESESSSDYEAILTDMEQNLGKEVPFDYSYGRDGLYESEDEVAFAIFSRAEVEEMINVLQQALESGYKE